MAIEQWIETREAKQCGNSAHILVPKRFRGETFRLELVNDGDMEWGVNTAGTGSGRTQTSPTVLKNSENRSTNAGKNLKSFEISAVQYCSG